MDVLKTLFDIWTIVGMVVGFVDFKYFNRKIRLGSRSKKAWIVFCLGPFWWVMMPFVFFAAWITK